MGSHFFFLLIVLVLGTMPLWPYRRTWDDYPSGLVAMMFSAVLLVISGRVSGTY